MIASPVTQGNCSVVTYPPADIDIDIDIDFITTPLYGAILS